MAKVRFTPDQQKAIDTLDKNILVSAAAGSGKTAVLIERIINIIIKGLAGVDEMLVVTFTNAAASEMKIKLSKAIRDRIKENPDEAEAMQTQLDKLYRSYISTFSSFAGRVVREFFYLADVDPGFKIMDTDRGALLERETMDDLFDYAFENDDFIAGGSFRDFLNHYSDGRSEDRIISEMIDTYHKLRSMPDYFEWAEARAEDLKMPEGGYRESPVFTRLCGYIADRLEESESVALEFLSTIEDAGLPNSADKFRPECRMIKSLAERARAGNMDSDFFDDLSSVEFARFINGPKEKAGFNEIKPEIKPLREEYKNEVKSLADEFSSVDVESQFREMDSTYPYVKYYISLLREFEGRFDAAKKEENMMDFADIEHTAYRILKDDSAAEVLRNRFKYIFIDEYQDTNYLQEELISRIAGKGNVFKVGDIKQSIYSFRQAEPGIFTDTHRRYESDPDSMNIDLNMNFRSSHSTIRYINDVFSEIMEGYDSRAALHPGLPKTENYEFEPEFDILFVNKSEDDEDDEIEQRSKDELEAAFVASRVKEIIGSDFYDSKAGVVRKAEPRDVVILMRSVTSTGDIFYKQLIEAGITAHVSDEEGYFDTVEINVFLALLNAVDNIRQDVPLIAVLHSEIFGFTPDELGRVRAAYQQQEDHKSGASYWEALKYYIENTDDDLSTRLGSAVNQLREWKELSGLMPLEDYIWKLLLDSGYYMYAGAMYDGSQRQANLRTLVDKAITFRENGLASLGEFIRYLGVLKKQEVKTGQAKMAGADDNVVRIMTIHKSKGLEFPFVIIAGMSRKLTYTSSAKGMMFDSGVGIGLSYVNRDEHYYRNTVIQRLICNSINDREYEEQLRVLYVAMTRARNKLIMTATVKDQGELDKLEPGRTSYLKMLAPVIDVSSCSTNIYEGFNPPTEFRERRVKDYLKARADGRIKTGTALKNEIDGRLSWKYPYEEELKLKAKYSVSELRREAVGNGSGFHHVIRLADAELDYGDAMQQERSVTAADRGTAYHRIMEFTDFGKAVKDGGVDTAYIDEQAEKLHSSGSIEDDIWNELDLRKVYSFFEQEIGRRTAGASRDGRLLKEKPFTLEVTRDGRQILVQGIIDCVFQENGKAILVDYKSNKARGTSEENRRRLAEEYRPQIDLYRRAIEEGTGLKVDEAYLYLFDTAELIEMQN